MKKTLLQFSAGVATFSLGLLFTTLFVIDSSQDAVILAPVDVREFEEAPHENSSLTFESNGGIACGFDRSGAQGSWTSYEASDGVLIQSEHLLFESEKSAAKRFRKLMASGDLIESKSYLNYRNGKIGEKALIKKRGKFVSISLGRSDDKFTILSLTSTSARHLSEFERQGEERSSEVNRLEP